ncbi:MAG TPA: hypothetical protein DEO70_14440 [Bacteroidales bacterium]|nr:MAG: hypothetical protein A2X11_13240 [Bacteroidetes bacterium GWE2_42_24]OFY26765.1 MAG: hypothetical protein A2X09_10190 [Bacteroidetes bacterium GWF2_43_11]HBZ68030.1 hypothetical protein [Bacteroidales bacterium]
MNTKTSSQKAFNWPVIRQYAKKYLIWLFAFIIITAAILFYMKYYHTYSEGYKEGYLLKFSQDGVLFKTFEGEMTFIDLFSETSIKPITSKFKFSVTSSRLASQFDTIQRKLIVVHYKKKKGTLLWRGESKFIVDSVKIKK